MCRLQGASYVLMSCLKVEIFMLFVVYCECCWPVCTGCCGFVCYVVQLRNVVTLEEKLSVNSLYAFSCYAMISRNELMMGKERPKLVEIH
jgi:hypothetical protein